MKMNVLQIIILTKKRKSVISVMENAEVVLDLVLKTASFAIIIKYILTVAQEITQLHLNVPHLALKICHIKYSRQITLSLTVQMNQ